MGAFKSKSCLVKKRKESRLWPLFHYPQIPYAVMVFAEVASFEAAKIFMDEEIRENLHGEIAPCTEQEFFTAYEKLAI